MTLTLLAAGAQELRLLLWVIDAFRGDGQAKSFAKTDQRIDNRSAFTRIHALDEALVYLDLVELDVSQVIQAGVARPKIVERDSHAGFAQAAEYVLRAVDVRNQRALRDFDFKALRRKAALVQNLDESGFPAQRLRIEITDR